MSSLPSFLCWVSQHVSGLFVFAVCINLTLSFARVPIKLQNLSKTGLMVGDFEALMKSQTHQS